MKARVAIGSEHVKSRYLTDTDFVFIFGGTSDSRYSRLKRMVAKGELIHVRRGLYVLSGDEVWEDKINPFELAQHIYGPSYISLESALSYHGLIPEAVYTTTSVTSARTREFNTPLGKFSYQHQPYERLLTEVELCVMGRSPFFMAKPWKAICDYVYSYKKDWRSIDPLIHDLRIDVSQIPLLLQEKIFELSDYYQTKRIDKFLAGISRELTVIRAKKNNQK